MDFVFRTKSTQMIKWKFHSEFKWKGPFWFLLTGIFGITSGGGPHISVEIFRDSSFNMTKGDEDMETQSLKF